MELTHFNEQGRARMVDVTEKAVTHRRAVAAGEMKPFSSPSMRPMFIAQTIASLAQALTLSASGAVMVPLTLGSPARR